MPKVLLSHQQHRKIIGNSINWQDRKQKSQNDQNSYIQYLARTPGRHSDNIRRQNMAYTTLQLIAMLSSARNCSLNPAVTPQRADELKALNRLLAVETHSSAIVTSELTQQHAVNRRRGFVAERAPQPVLISSMLQSETEKLYRDAPILAPPEDLMNNGLNTMLHSVSNALYKTGQFILQYDLLRFPMASAYTPPQRTHTQNVEQVMLWDTDGEIANLTCGIAYPETDCNFIKNSQKTLAQYYKDYNAKYPNLRQLIIANLREKIRTHFHMDIEPDNVRFTSIDNLTDQEKEKIHFSQQFKDKTLTEWFFTSFNRNIENNTQAINAVVKLDNAQTMELRKLFKLLDKIDFYNAIREKVSQSFQDKEMHIKKYFIDFICHLKVSEIDNEAVKDVLSGVGLLRGRTVYTSLLDINDNIASTAFCFCNEAGQLSLYFPESAFKFISFQNKTEMTQWLLRVWSEQSQRDMIASHFENWHNKVLYSELVEQLNVTRQGTKIATEQVYVPTDRFFAYLFTQIRDKILFDLTAISKSAVAMSRENVLEKMMAVPRTTPDFTLLFSSLNTHLNAMIEAGSYYKKSKEWCITKNSTIDTLLMSMLNKMIKFPYKGGYAFINTVIKSIQTVDIKKLKPRPETVTTVKPRFLKLGDEYLTKFYEDYNSKYLGLNMLARSVLKEKIQERFKLQLDPDKVRFVLFNGVVYAEEKKHSIVAGIRLNQTLEACLFTNFDSQVRNNLPDMDAMGGLYESSVWSKKVLRASDEVKIKPTDFIKLVDDIDFYNYAKDKLTESFKDKDVHIKKYFFDFVNHLSDSQIDEEAVKDVQAGVGIGKGRKIRVTLFDINKYSAANAFVFRNENGRVTLYFPGSDFKFMSFRTETEMRSWVINACSTKEHRAMIASHFTIENRQDGTFYYGVDAWLNFMNKNSDYSDRVAIGSKDVDSEHFFLHLFELIKDKTFSDLDSLIKSDAEVRRDMWEEMIDASNIIPNPISPFVSLAFHLEHAIEADTYAEKQQEWDKIESDAVNLVVMVALSKAIDFPNKQGYEFIDLVNKDVQARNLNQGIGIAEMNPNVVLSPDSSSNSWEWLFNQVTDDDKQVTYEITGFMAPLKTFLPLTEIEIESDMNVLNAEINELIVSHYHQYEFDIFYGLDHPPDSEIPVYIHRASIRIKKHLDTAREHLRNVFHKLRDDNYTKDIKQFLSLVVESTDQNVLDQTYSRLQILVARAINLLDGSERINHANIGMVSSKQILNTEQPFLFKSGITDPNILRVLPTGFVHIGDPLRRIYIVLDAIIDSPQERNIFVDKGSTVYDAFIHEASHLSSHTFDIFYFEIRLSNTMQENVNLMLGYFNAAMNAGATGAALMPFKNFMEIVRQYFGEHRGITEADVVNKVRVDPMLKANVIMENADTFVLCIREIARMSLEQRVKREEKNLDDKISEDLVNFYLKSLFSATHCHQINAYTMCK